MADQEPIPVIDLFAGPGGLGEGFPAFSLTDATRPFKITLSIEMEECAHRTLELRSSVWEVGKGDYFNDCFRVQFADRPARTITWSRP